MLVARMCSTHALAGPCGRVPSCITVRPGWQQALADRGRCHSAATSVASTTAHLVNWIISANGQVNSVGVGALGHEGLGLVATQRHKKGASLVKLPAACQLQIREDTHPALLDLIDKIPPEIWGARLAVNLLAERLAGQQSYFVPYISQLPIGFPGLPMFFNSQSIAALQYVPAINQIKFRNKWMISYVGEHLAPNSGDAVAADHPLAFQTLDANVMGWAFAAVTSRAFRVRPGGSPAMMPLIDMCNHSSKPNAEVRAMSKGAVELYALRDLSAGESVTFNYGADLQNDMWLLDYGFVVPGNRSDRVSMPFSTNLVEIALGSQENVDFFGVVLRDDQKYLLEKLQLIGSLASPKSTQVFFGRGEALVDSRLLAAFRIVSATEQQLAAARKQNLGQLSVAPVGRATEAEVARMLSTLAEVLLTSFQTTLRQDWEILENSTASWEERLAVSFRVEKKDLLANVIREMQLRQHRFQPS